MKFDPFVDVNQLYYYKCLALAENSAKVKDAKFWKSMGSLANCLLFRSIMWIKEACEEFNKEFSEQTPLIPEENVNFLFLPKQNNYVFIAEDAEVNKKFIKFCLNHKESKKWLIQLEEN